MKYLILVLALIACTPQKGDQGAPGTSIIGAPGHDGDSIIGPPGRGGTPGTVITIVDLCPDVTVYPNTFIEIALCVQGRLYGVYSANNGFLTYFPPGDYFSNAIGSACNLTIQPNCIVSH